MMVQKGDSSVDVFDYIAEQIAYLRKLSPKAWADKTVRETIVKPPDLEASVSSLFEKYPSLNNTKELLRHGIPRRVVDDISEWVYKDSFIGSLELVVRLSRKLPYSEILKRVSKLKERGGFEALNKNITSTGLHIIPRVPSINDDLAPANAPDVGFNTEKHWADDRSCGINQELSNIMYIETDALQVQNKFFQVKHHIIEQDFFPAGKKVLLLGVSPLAKGDFLNIDYETRMDGENLRSFFRVTGLKNSDVVKAKIEAAVLAACEQKVDILIFSEMLGSGEIVDQAFADHIAEVAAEKGLAMPSVILWPTWWHDFRNELYVTDGSGETICTQHKQYAFKYTDEDTNISYAEDLQGSEQVIHVIHIPHVGRLTFPICRDYLEPGYVHLMADPLKSTFLICPSYSTGKTQFDLTSPGEIKYGCYTVWINTCAARYKDSGCPSYVGLVSGPLAKGEYIKRLEPKCNGACDENQPCLFLIQVSMDHLANISYKHTREDKT